MAGDTAFPLPFLLGYVDQTTTLLGHGGGGGGGGKKGQSILFRYTVGDH